jgi:hypothetical protein
MPAWIRFRIASESDRLDAERLSGIQNLKWCCLGLSHRLNFVAPVRAAQLVKNISMAFKSNVAVVPEESVLIQSYDSSERSAFRKGFLNGIRIFCGGTFYLRLCPISWFH